ncbi:MAG: DUF2213 domain-containing protein [Candidatus Bathyarchaeota archaeon]|nr:DUF2213 domain-containing protein [Candidatus Bathyarchaeota archaeon]
MTWEENQETIRSEHRPLEEFQKDTIKTASINDKEGIQAIVGKPIGKQTLEIQSYLFAKECGWTVEKAKEWFSKNCTAAKEHVCAVLPFMITEKISNKPLKISGLAMTVGMSRNFNIYTPKELEAFASKLVNAPVYIEHVTSQNAVGKVTKTDWNGQNLLYEAEIFDEETAAKIRKGLIRHVSVGADYQTIDLVNGKIPHGLYNAEISLVAVPGIPETNIQILEKLHLCEQEFEPMLSGEYTLGFYQDASAFLPEHFSLFWLDRANGVLAIMGKIKSNPDQQRTQAILFSKEKMWDTNRIRDWLSLHPTYLTSVVTQPQQDLSEISESLIKKPLEPTIPLNQAIKLIESVLPSHLVQRSWSLGPQRMCQELNRVLLKLRSMQDSHTIDRK